MQKKKKLFSFEPETINTEELEEDIKQAEQLISKLKDQVDPKAEKLKRRKELLYNLLDSLYILLIVFACIAGFAAGCDIGFKQAERIYNYSVTVGAITTVETE